MCFSPVYVLWCPKSHIPIRHIFYAITIYHSLNYRRHVSLSLPLSDCEMHFDFWHKYENSFGIRVAAQHSRDRLHRPNEMSARAHKHSHTSFIRICVFFVLSFSGHYIFLSSFNFNGIFFFLLFL